MATYQELKGLVQDSDLQDKIEVAVVIAANNLLSGTPTAADKAWAGLVLGSPEGEAKKALRAVLATNASASVSVILSVADSVIQTQVNAVTPILVDALAGV